MVISTRGLQGRRGCLAVASTFTAVTVGVLVSACAKPEDSRSHPGSQSARASGAASGAGAPSVANGTPSPALWDTAFSELLGKTPRRPEPTAAIGAPYPHCANSEARAVASARYGEAYGRAVASAAAGLVERQREADAAWIPNMLGWERARALIAADSSAGVYLGKVDGVRRVQLPAATEEAMELAPLNEGASAARLRSSLGDGGSRPFECEVVDVARSNPGRADSLVDAPEQVDWVSCRPRGASLVVLAIPSARRRAVVAVTGDRASVKGHEPLADVADPALRALLDAAVAKPRVASKATLKVSGVSRIWRAPSVTGTAGVLLQLGGPVPFADRIREGFWIAAFDRACQAQGLGCDVEDGLSAAAVSLVSPPQATTPAPSADARPKQTESSAVPARSEAEVGRWEAAVLAVDPEVERHPSNSPWQNGFFSSAPGGALGLTRPPRVGERVTPTPVAERSSRLVDAWRDDMNQRGGVVPFRCTVVDLGQRMRGQLPFLRAALAASGEPRKEARDYIDIICRGDEQSYKGTIVVMVPAYASWAIVEVDGSGSKGQVREYKLEHHGFFDPSLRGKLVDIGAGTVLNIAAAPRITRSSFNGYGIDQEIPGTVWAVDLGGFRCAHEGLGCPLFDGAALPLVTAERLNTCAASSHEWPPAPSKPAPDPALKGITPADPPTPVQVRTRAKDAAEQVFVPAGAFIRGDATSDSSPRIVTLSAFWMDRHEVTVGRYMGCVEAAKCTFPGSGPWCTVTAKDRNLPVNCVSRDQAHKYCEWVGGSLPSDAQWEKAARGTDDRPYPWGWTAPSCAVASLRNGVGLAEMGCNHGGARPVGAFPAGASAYGALDMSGNVWEWVLDAHDPGFLKQGGHDPVRRDDAKPGVIRGGSFGDQARELSVATRQKLMAGLATEGTGLRCVNTD